MRLDISMKFLIVPFAHPPCTGGCRPVTVNFGRYQSTNVLCHFRTLAKPCHLSGLDREIPLPIQC